MTIKMKGAAALVAALAIVATAGAAVAQSGYPDHNVRMLVGYPPGGPVDIIGRVVSDRLSQIWGKPVVVENIHRRQRQHRGRPRRQGRARRLYVAGVDQRPARGQSQSLQNDVRSGQDLTPISLAVYSPNILVVPNDVPAKNVKELVAYLKANGGQELRFRRRRHHAGTLPASCSSRWRMSTSSTCRIAARRR